MSSLKTESKNAVRAYILAGGYSSRFGSDKARHVYHGEPLLMHVARSIAGVSSSITVVADKPRKFHDLGLRTICDTVPHTGPMGGLLTALRDNPEPGWRLVVSCDMIGIQSHWLDALIRDVKDSHSTAVAFSDGKPQPFPGLYHTDILAADYETTSIASMLNQYCKLLPIPPDWHEATNINSPVDLLIGRP